MRCSACRLFTLLLLVVTSPAWIYISLLLAFLFCPSPLPKDIEGDALSRLLKGEEVTRVFEAPNEFHKAWDRNAFALSFSYNATTSTLFFPYSSTSIPVFQPHVSLYNLTVHTGDTYYDSFFSPADDILIWAATRPLVSEEFKQELPIEMLLPADSPSRLGLKLGDTIIITILFSPPPSLLPTRVIFPTLHVDNSWKKPLEVIPKRSKAHDYIPPVNAPSLTLPFRLYLINTFGPLTLAIGRAIDDGLFSGFLDGALRLVVLGLECLFAWVVWIACGKPFGSEWWRKKRQGWADGKEREEKNRRGWRR